MAACGSATPSNDAPLPGSALPSCRRRAEKALIMESTFLLPSLLSTQTPLLPAPGVARVYLSVSWALVLAGISVMLLQRRVADRRVTQGLPLLLALVCLLPGVDSPAYW